MRYWLRVVVVTGNLLMLAGRVVAQEGFRVHPYVQYPKTEAISILWFSETATPGLLSWWEQHTGNAHSRSSNPEQATTLAYPAWEDSVYFNKEAPAPPYKHMIRLDGLTPDTEYGYRVVQETDTFYSSFRTVPSGMDSLRVIFYADSETEPESTGNFTNWIDPDSGTSRKYLVDQTTGYRQNLEVIRSRHPDLIFIAGDLTQHGGEQRDWDEFWRHNTDPDGQLSLAGKVPLMAALGNHEYYEGTYLGQYNQPGSERAVHRFLTYFETPPNHAPDPEQEGRYYNLNYGPASFIVLDLCNNSPNGSDDDTNFYLLGAGDPEGGHSPGFGPGSDQRLWLEARLEEAQRNSLFTFVIFHHAPYSSGPHGFPPGEGDTLDTQSGVPVRSLTPLFMQYGVDVVCSGHDEIWERSEYTGMEMKPDGELESHTIQFYDVGVGGDGLRGSVEGTDNPYQKFLVHSDVPEIWENGILIEGGKHYGHLEVDIVPVDESTWQAILTPAYVFPLYNAEDSAYTGFERREYDDRIVVTCTLPDTAVSSKERVEFIPFIQNHPNPFDTHTTIHYRLASDPIPGIIITDVMGRQVRILETNPSSGTSGQVIWDGTDGKGTRVPPGLYYYSMTSLTGERVSRAMLFLH